MTETPSLFAEIAAWQREHFPLATPASTLTHLGREVLELQPSPSSGEEQADVLFLLIQLADRTGVDLIASLRWKFEVNKQRAWQEPDADGVVEHVR